MNLKNIILLLIPFQVLFSLFSCTPANSQKDTRSSTETQEFRDYWYAGKAELTRYELKQARYGEVHEGDAVLIFVTEDFKTKEQVKYEYGDRDQVAPILKLNFTKKFNTGIYPYSMMSSIFTPVDFDEPTIKVTTSSQEWCGHTFSQLNLDKKKYNGRLFSYFQSEGDQEFSLDAAMLEDEIWTKIRLNPNLLPIGDIKIIPGSMFLRLKHIEYKVEKAKASMEAATNANLSKKKLITYNIVYKDIKRSLSITYESDFPHTIVAWEEKGLSGFGDGAKELITKAVRTHSLQSAYWSQHDLKDAHLRKQLGLE